MKDRLAAVNNGGCWIAKIAANMERDAQQTAELERLGWAVLGFWGSDAVKDAAGCAVIVKMKLEEIRMKR